MRGRKLGVLLGVFGIGVAALAAGCSAGAGTDGSQEKVAATSQALIKTDPTPPTVFPNNNAKPADCSYVAPNHTVQGQGPAYASWQYAENYIAFPVHDTTDPYRTAYSHEFSWGDCQKSGSLNCQLESDFYSIPNANGFKYMVAQLTYQGGRNLTQGTSVWELEGINRADESYEFYPWNAGGNGLVPWCTHGTNCSANQTYFDSNSHPPYGTDARSADWAQLWNLAWTYSYNANPQGPNNSQTSSIESTEHACTFIYVCPGGTKECAENSDCPSGQQCYPDLNDPGMTCWAPCYNYQTGTFDANTGALVTQDFFPAAERHDPYPPPW